MHVLTVWNRQRSVFGGEEQAILSIEDMLARHGHTAARFERSSLDIGHGASAKLGAALCGIYSFASRRALARRLAGDRPDVVHFHNIYPLLSQSVIDACRIAGIPAVMSVHSHILTCPNWYHVRNGVLCEKCLGGRAYQCLLTNCRGRLTESAAYAARSMAADILGGFRRPGLVLAPVSSWLGERLASAGYARERLVVVPNRVEVPETAADPASGAYVAAAGRLSAEKGFDILIEASRRTGLPVRIAGDGPLRGQLESSSPPQVLFPGQLDSGELDGFYRGARFVVVSSIASETFGLVAAEAMVRGVPVIASGTGGLVELAGGAGRLVVPGNPVVLAEAMTALWNDPAALRRLGAAARERILANYGEAAIYERLMTAYRRAGVRAEGAIGG